MQVNATAASARERVSRQQETEQARMGVDMAKHKSQMAQQQRTAFMQRQQQQPPKKEK
jgi:hypothetical protein